MTWILTAQTTLPAVLETEVVDPVQTRVVRYDAEGQDHDLDVLGLRPGVPSTITVTAVAGEERVSAAPIVVTAERHQARTGYYVDVAVPERMEPGYTLVRDQAKIVVVDHTGTPIWSFGPVEDEYIPMELHRTASGNIRVLNNRYWAREQNIVFEIDMRGNEVARWAPAAWAAANPGTIGVDALAFHHEAHPGPNDTLFTLGVEGLLVPDYPTSETDPYAPRPRR